MLRWLKMLHITLHISTGAEAPLEVTAPAKAALGHLIPVTRGVLAATWSNDRLVRVQLDKVMDGHHNNRLVQLGRCSIKEELNQLLH